MINEYFENIGQPTKEALEKLLYQMRGSELNFSVTFASFYDDYEYSSEFIRPIDRDFYSA